ncbi:MAG: sigma-70 family RNA polymerase sigma factor, partial [Bacteroidales bacterium]|nr:sigma-70 family RNA polymerase sigma factor [Bacteroidales bacterium]
SHLRKAAGRAVTSIPETISSQDSASAAIDAEDSRRIVAAALRQIPEGTRQLLQLRTAGMSLDEIAAVTGRSKGSVKSSISAARKQVLKVLKES